MQLKRLRGCIIYRPLYAIIIFFGVRVDSICIISLGVGWLALLIFEKGQCEGLKTGVSAEE
ncbi:MAG: hypothetical protein IJ421_01545 [Prevotella sp.]|nr:hypothetical protein [Prevotella sp.]MBQ8628141.1 hypothetical protein [Prevotella sp.]